MIKWDLAPQQAAISRESKKCCVMYRDVIASLASFLLLFGDCGRAIPPIKPARNWSSPSVIKPQNNIGIQLIQINRLTHLEIK